jgi:hypothetical protein
MMIGELISEEHEAADELCKLPPVEELDAHDAASPATPATGMRP